LERLPVRLRRGREVAAAVPALALAYRADRRADHLGGAVRGGERARHAVLQLAQLLGALARRDVLADAAVTLEHARRVEERLAADQHPARLALLVQPADLEVVERQVR